MVHPLYWISDFVYTLVLGAILLYDLNIAGKPSAVERSFRRLLRWVMYFCLQDMVWGLCASSLSNTAALFASSTVFHMSTVLTTFFWLDYVLHYLNIDQKRRRICLCLDGCIVLLQIAMLIANLFTPTVFYVDAEGRYVTAFLRIFAFMNQYIVYLVMLLIAGIRAVKEREERRGRYWTVFMFTMGPVLSGVFQYLDPNGPYYSIGYFLGCILIHLFIVNRERDELKQMQADRAVAEQVTLSHTDGLTGMYNRRAYEDDRLSSPRVPVEDDYVYVSADINGLKEINDTYGHASGDEMLKGAAACLSRCLGTYGRIYRTGGDEFVATIFANEEKLASIRWDIEQETLAWRGPGEKSLTIALGFASKREFPDTPVVELARIADERMYESKARWYKERGIDRRGQHAAYEALCSSYTKILRVNLTRDTYQIICMDQSERTEDKGFAAEVSTWLHNFGTSGQVHPNDLAVYLQKTDIHYLRSYFAEDKRSLTIFYKRLINNVYRQAMMELIIAEDYTHDNQTLYLYVKDIDR